ncbi:MAG: ABC transporter permease subunit [Lentihominibacter sp.]|jgi:ABC-2 type transport system permease protein
MNIIKTELKTSLINIIVWSLVFLLFSFGSIIKFDSLLEAGEETLALLDRFPRVLLAIFNMADVDVATLPGYFAVIASYFLLMSTIHGLFFGIRLFAREEQEKTADFLLTKPRSRRKIFAHKLISGILVVLILQTVLFICNYLALQKYLPDARTMLFNYTFAFLELHLLSLIFGILLINIAPRGKAESIGLGVILTAYFIPVLANMSEDWYFLRDYFPFNMFLRETMEASGDIPTVKLTVLLALTLIFVLIGVFRFEKKDILV